MQTLLVQERIQEICTQIDKAHILIQSKKYWNQTLK